MSQPAGSRAVKRFLPAAALALAALVQPAARAQVVTLTPSSLPAPTAGFAYSQTISASGGQAPYVFSIESGMLPPGLTLAPNGLISGAASNTAPFNFALYGTDFDGREGILSTTLSPAAALVLANSSLVFQIGQTVNTPTPAANGTAPYSCSTASAMPPGMALSAACVLSGQAASLGGSVLAIHIVDVNGVQGNVNLSILVTPVLFLANPTITHLTGNPFSVSISAGNGVAPYTCAVLSALPPGVSISPACVLSATQTAAGTYLIRLHLVDNSGAYGDADLTLQLVDPLVIPVTRGWLLAVLSLLLTASAWLRRARS